MIPEIKVGQQWREVDPRFTRIVEILAVGTGTIRPIKLRTILFGGSEFIGRATYANRERFNGKRGGYALVKEAVCN